MVDRAVRPRRLPTLLLVLVLAVSACTVEADPTDPTDDPTTTTTEATTTTVVPPPEVDVGVDLEAGVLRLAVVGDVSDDLWAGHFAYWDSVNQELGGVGGRFSVELVRVPSLSDIDQVGALAVSLDAGDDRGATPGVLVVAQPDGSGTNRLADLLGGTADRQLAIAVTALDRLGEVVAPVPERVLLVQHPERSCSDNAGLSGVEAVGVDSVPATGAPLVALLCVPEEELLSAAAAALRDNPGSLLVVPGAEWAPERAAQLDGSQVVVAGYLPEPGADGVPGADLMGLLLGAGPWSGDLVAGYRWALSVHAVLERALAQGDLTRRGLVQTAEDLGPIDVGFQSGRIAIATLDTSSPTGLRFALWADG